jgi:outer membrane lipoprotein LolB
VQAEVRGPRTAILLLLACVLLAGCASMPPVAPPAPSEQVPDPAVLTQWVAKGRIALAAGGEGGSGSFVWQQRSERTEVSFRGPLGAGGLQIVTDGERLELIDAEGRALDGDAARAALKQRLGIDLPLADLRFWMLGVPAPESGGVGAVRIEPPQTGFRQRDWEVTYAAFRPVSGWSLPAKVNAASGDVRVRIVVDDWQLPAP